ncbi:hypothetical protein JHD49_06960 [Sulfurimonas sp. SAG-AH-194-C21]|nr:hypothetical protein [Sulfurimonas sp. SAG-AH-194-C21]MDF1883675.1 hypothetical protein [Sulfurimonas sp. SAG-AH-194-C21]
MRNYIMHKLLQHKILIFFLILLTLLIVSFKSLLIKGGEWYLGDLLKEEVRINSLVLYPTQIKAYIQKPQNRASLRVINEFPLQAELTYDGNMNAFKEYVALDANTSLFATIFYEKELVIDAEGDISIPAFDTLHINTKLNMIDENLSLFLEVAFNKNSEYNFDANVNKEGNTTLVNLQSDAFGGETEALFEDDKLKVRVKNIHLLKLLQQYGVDVKAKGYISALAQVDTKTFKSTLLISSPKITYEKEVLEDVVFDIQKLSYEKERLKLDYILSLKYADEKLSLSGDVDYKDRLSVHATTKLFGSSTDLHYLEDKISVSAKGIDTQELLTFLKLPLYAKGKFTLNLEGKIDNLDVVVQAKSIVLDKNLTGLDDSVSLNVNANYTPKKVSFQTQAKAKTFELGKSKGVYNLVKKELHLEQNLKLLYEKKFVPLFVNIVYADEVLRVKSPSFGGKLDLTLKDKKVNILMKELEVDKIAKIAKQQLYVKGGAVNGKVFYDIDKKKARTKIRVNNMYLQGIDLDTTLGAMGLNVFNITSSFLDDDTSKITNIQHMQINLEYQNEMIHLSDVAFATPKYRVAALGNIHKDGNITSLDIHILDKSGCSSLEQKLSGSVYDIKLDNKLSTSVDVVSAVPGSLVSGTKSIFDFATGAIDKTATFVVNKSHLSENKISLVSNIGDTATGGVSSSADVVRLECKAVYKGSVKHPLKD